MNLEINLNILLIWREELPSSKLIISIIVFSFFYFFFTSIIKNKTRIIEKELILYEKKISYLEKELHESQLDFHYLTSPEILQNKIAFLTSDEYQHMSISNIYLDYYNFISDQKKNFKKIIYAEKKK